MTREFDQYTEWDAAYLLGALSPEERWEYERHLADCPTCSRSLAELAGVPALLSLVPADQVVPAEQEGPADQVAPADQVVPDVASAADPSSPTAWTRLRDAAHAERRRTRRTRRLVAGSILAAAAVLVSIVLVVPGLRAPTVQPEANAFPAVTLTQVMPSALSAEVRLRSEPWGTRIEATCIYADSGSNSGPGRNYGTGEQTYALYVTDRNGVSSRVSQWAASPGATVEPVGTTNVTQGEIASVDIRSVATGQVLLSTQIGQ
ncbi:anti-sigma factor [Leifsonia sp. YAF41]|uniref:anti-sigma factor n=1 Tax=Leifsonia sp. YAF41 TaxID=3233086 RepID=UPI003F9B9673